MAHLTKALMMLRRYCSGQSLAALRQKPRLVGLTWTSVEKLLVFMATSQPQQDTSNTIPLYYKNYMSSAYKDDEKALKKIIREELSRDRQLPPAPQLRCDWLTRQCYYHDRTQ
ncbi:hypothetical protein E2C01_099116 [Portunus trituberculatus]|uniref:Uncharacterized protein n=1 Tax=Portunus trituberculatus TaxID=210409 RepID=A0A5B7K9H1_PORTR|nr:hypothetical protein [Portunus trituberculatus]